LTSTGSRSDYSSCDAKKSQDSKIATDLDCGDSRADSLNAKLREGSKNTSSSNDPEEKNTSEDNPNSKLTSTGSRSDYSSCDAKKSQDSKIATDLGCGKASADSNSQGINANFTSEHASDNGNATIEEQYHDSYSKNSSVSDNRKKRQESKNTSEDDAVSEDANENGKNIHGSKNASENDSASKENTSNAIQGEVKDHDKSHFTSPSEELNAYIASPNKNNSTCDNTRRFNNTSTLKSINTVSSKHITPILSTNYVLTKESVTSLSLFTLSLFLHETKECLINQPNANYRTLVVNNLKKKSFQTAMTTDTNDITEEIYITVYEIAKYNNSSCISPSFPKIHATYSTQENTYERPEIPGLHAIDPTKEGLQKLIAACKFPDKESYCFNDDIHTSITDIFSNIKLHQASMLEKVYLEDHSAVDQGTPTLHKNLYERYRKFRERFQKKHPIRIAIAGGLHRTALATHLLGNWHIHNAPPKIMESTPSKSITISSPLNKDIVVHILSPKGMGSGFTNVYLEEVRKISEDVNNRSYNQLKLTKSAQLFDLLVQTSNEITEKRFIPQQLYETKEVSKKYYLLQ